MACDTSLPMEEEEDIDELTGWIKGTADDPPATATATRNERRENPQRAGARTTIVPEFAPLRARRWVRNLNDDSKVVAPDPRPIVQLCERENNEVMMASKDVE